MFSHFNALMVTSVRNVLLVVAVCGLHSGAALAAPPGEIPFGVYDPPGNFTNDPNVQIEHLFLPWEDVYLPSLLDADRYALDRNRALLVTIEPWTWNRSERNTPAALYAGIKSGEYDHYMRDLCEVLDQMESPITVRFGQEMDDHTSQFIWAGWKPENFIFMYRKMIGICRDVAPRIRTMWSPIGYQNMAAFYPGDDFVDLIGLSVFGYQPWEEDILGRPLTFEDILAPRYERAAQFNKPVVVPELGYVGDDAYVTQWENDIRQPNPKFPNLVGVVYFNQREVYPWPNNYGLPDWRVDEQVLSN